MRLPLIAALLWLIALPAMAVQPDEVLDDPALEARARELSKELRCLVCRNESIDDSNASLARDLRLVLRERLVEGDSDEQAMDFIVDRYGEYVLLRPTLNGANLALWLAAPAFLVIGGLISFGFLRRHRATAGVPVDAGLSEDETARLQTLLKED